MEEVQLLSSQLKLCIFPNSIGSQGDQGMVSSLGTEMENGRNTAKCSHLFKAFWPIGDVGCAVIIWRLVPDILSSKSARFGGH